ncbi:MAG: hypothetical protein HY760_06285 [Nitrospirae bacterium]|nr:hypothetical protein [Nitrospirota bacterium]
MHTTSRPVLRSLRHIFSVLLVFILAGCAGQSDPPASGSHEALIFVGNDGDGTVSVIEHGHDGDMVSETILVGSGAIGDLVATTEDHIFVNVTDNNAVAAIDPMVSGNPELRNFLPVGSRPVHGYRDPEGTRVWVMNDGDATSGSCKTAGPGGIATNSVTVIQNHEVDGGGGNGTGILGEVIATICVGRGHHKAAFSEPSADHPDTPHRVFVSNISDGTVSVIDNDPVSADYLTVIATIDLCDPDKQSGGCDGDLATTNNASPHGIDFSPVSGKIYNANVGYGTVAVIDPETNTIETSIDAGFVNKVHVSPGGAFVLVKGTDKTSDADHVIGKLTVIDTATDTVANQIDLIDIHPDSFEFSPDGIKLYVASASTGTDAQKANLKDDVLLAFDSSALPDLKHPETGISGQAKEITVGVADGGHRSLAIHEHEGMAEHVFVPNPADDTVSVVDAETDEVVDTVEVGDDPGSILVFPVEGGHSH